jgi:hypothetical protein
LPTDIFYLTLIHFPEKLILQRKCSLFLFTDILEQFAHKYPHLTYYFLYSAMAGQLSTEVTIGWASLPSDILIRVATMVAGDDDECHAIRLGAGRAACRHWSKHFHEGLDALHARGFPPGWNYSLFRSLNTLSLDLYACSHAKVHLRPEAPVFSAPNLKNLILEGASGDVVRYIVNGLEPTNRLTYMHVKGYEELFDNGIQAISRLTSLEKLQVTCPCVPSDYGAGHLSSLTNLTDLALTSIQSPLRGDWNGYGTPPPVSGDSIRVLLEGMTGLKHLYLGGNGISDGFQHLGHLTGLEILRWNDKVAGQLSPLTALTNLKMLVLDNYRDNLTIDDFIVLASMTSLEMIQIVVSELADEWLVVLSHLPRLSYIHVTYHSERDYIPDEASRVFDLYNSNYSRRTKRDGLPYLNIEFEVNEDNFS